MVTASFSSTAQQTSRLLQPFHTPPHSSTHSTIEHQKNSTTTPAIDQTTLNSSSTSSYLNIEKDQAENKTHIKERLEEEKKEREEKLQAAKKEQQEQEARIEAARKERAEQLEESRKEREVLQEEIDKQQRKLFIDLYNVAKEYQTVNEIVTMGNILTNMSHVSIYA